MAARKTRTKYEGVLALHRKGCAEPGCCCAPSFYARVRRHDREQGQGGFGTAREAAAWRRMKLVELDDAHAIQVKPPYLADAVAEFLRGANAGVYLSKRGRRYRPRTVYGYEGCLNKYVLPHLGSKRLSAIGRRDAQGVIDRMVEKDLSGKRVRHVLTACLAVWAWGYQRELVRANPWRELRLPMIGETPRDRIATPAEMGVLLGALPEPDRLPLALAAYAGARRQEIRRLRWRDVDLDAGLIHLEADRDGKTRAATRTVGIASTPLPGMLRAALLRQGRPGPDAWVVLNTRAGRFHPDAYLKRCYTRWEAAGLQPIRLHEARHTFASWALPAGVELATLSKLMGHATVQITADRYQHLLPGAEQEAARKLGAYLARAQ